VSTRYSRRTDLDRSRALAREVGLGRLSASVDHAAAWPDFTGGSYGLALIRRSTKRVASIIEEASVHNPVFGFSASSRATTLCPWPRCFVIV